ncbi:hypothetical protein RF640_17900 [Kocuria sp. CPCC 205231]|uniref:hypothetical protein n=1 Tax=Kocuria sp. CPCC 205231 TaxID=3073551 RepID=UPI0034D4125E
MTPSDLAPIETIALDIARADMHYVATSLLGLSSTAAAEIALLQYGAMAAYEAQLHFEKALGWRLSAEWDADTARAARMSGKFFADTKRNLEGVVTHFEELLQANHGAFFPPNRRGRLFDFLRDDLSVVTLDGSPYTSLVSAHYLAGLRPEQVGDLATVSPAVGQLSVGIGNVAGILLQNSAIAPHRHGPIPPFRWFDGKSRVALPRLFGGELDPPLAAALLTVQSTSSSALQSVSRSLCSWCEAAARKHRFIALFQSLTALEIMRRDGFRSARSTDIMTFLDDPESVWILGQSRLRNGLVHLGLQDIASHLGPGSSIDDAIRAYTGLEPDAVAARTLNHLTRFVSLLTAWMLSPTADGSLFLAALRPAPVG